MASVSTVGGGGFLEDDGRVAARGCQQDAGFDHQPRECPFIRPANEDSEGLLDAAIVALLPDT